MISPIPNGGSEPPSLGIETSTSLGIPGSRLNRELIYLGSWDVHPSNALDELVANGLALIQADCIDRLCDYLVAEGAPSAIWIDFRESNEIRDLVVQIVRDWAPSTQVLSANKAGFVESIKNGAWERCDNVTALMKEGRPPESRPRPIVRRPELDRHRDDNYLRRFAESDMPVLLRGETGVGKEVAARSLYELSHRRRKPFVKVNCAALPADLVESELFGHEKGAFTGAHTDRPGSFELANGGTIFLDEIGDMDLRSQSRLLHVLQDQEVMRVGGRKRLRLDVRIIAATHRDLEEAIRAGTFRQDLYYRLNVLSMTLPPLRERTAEILPLAELLLRRHTPPHQAPPEIGMELRRAMLAYSWPGNVRELENVVRRLIVYEDPAPIIAEITGLDVAASTRGGEASASGRPTLKEIEDAAREAETRTILNVLEANQWNYRRAAKELDVDYKALLYRLKRLGISKNGETGSAGSLSLSA
jgi:DNA-binding NtrC family response regulator